MSPSALHALSSVAEEEEEEEEVVYWGVCLSTTSFIEVKTGLPFFSAAY